MRTFNSALLFLLLFSIGINSCKDNVSHPPNVNEEELITTLRLYFTDSAGIAPSITAAFRDPDGEGGQSPDLFDAINLAAHTTYWVECELLNEAHIPVDTITLEVLEEATAHLFCYTVTGAAVDIQRTDSDGVLELGILSRWTTGAASSGSVAVVLKHQAGLKDGSCLPGETDIDVTFTCTVQ